MFSLYVPLLYVMHETNPVTIRGVACLIWANAEGVPADLAGSAYMLSNFMFFLGIVIMAISLVMATVRPKRDFVTPVLCALSVGASACYMLLGNVMLSSVTSGTAVLFSFIPFAVEVLLFILHCLAGRTRGTTKQEKVKSYKITYQGY